MTACNGLNKKMGEPEKEKERTSMKAKKVLAMLMATAMIMGSTVTAFAADNIIGNSDDTGTITISGVTHEGGINVTAYPIISALYNNSNGSFSGYQSLYPTIITIPANGTVVDVNQEQLNRVLKELEGKSGLVEEKDFFNLSYDEESDTYVSANTLPVGSYLVVIEGAETKIYNPVVASISYVNEEGNNALDEDNISVIAPGNAWVKVSENPGVTKTVSDEDEDPNTDTNDKGNSANIGEEVTYTVEISPVPNYGGDYPVLNIVDNLSTGLTYVANSLTVERVQTGEDGEVVIPLNGNYYDTTLSDNQIIVDFVKDTNSDSIKEYTLNEYVGQTIRIKYRARVNEHAVINANGNNNNVTLNYTHDSKVNGEDDTVKDQTYTYTFDIDGSTTAGVITKTGEGDESQALPGARFELYTDKECTTEYSNPVFNTNLDKGELVSDSSGQLHMEGLEAGTYWLKEVDAPGKYSVNTHVFEIKIVTNYNEKDGKLISWQVLIDGQEAKTFTVDHSAENDFTSTGDGTQIKNTKISSLPGTGGIGTTIFTIGGCAIMVTAAGLYFVKRKKEQN